MVLASTEEEMKLHKIFAPYYDYTRKPALSPDAPKEAVEAYEKYFASFCKRYDEALDWLMN